MGCGASANAGRNHKAEKEARRKRKKEAKEHRRQVLQQLKESGGVEHLLENPHVRDRIELLADIPVPVIIWSGALHINDGVLLYANLAAEKLFDHDQQSLKVGNTLRKIIDADVSGVDKLDDIVYKTLPNLHGRKADGSTFVMTAYTTVLTRPSEDFEHSAFATVLQKSSAAADDVRSFGSFSFGRGKIKLSEAFQGGSIDGLRSSSVATDSPSPPLSPQASPHLERKLNLVGDILVVVAHDRKVAMLSDGAQAVFGNVPLSKLDSVDDLLHDRELKSLLHVLDEQGEMLDQRYYFKGVGEDEDKQDICPLQLASRTPLPDASVALRFVPPPKRRQVGFVRKKVLDEVAVLLDVLPEPTLLVGRKGDIRHCNPAAEALFGWSFHDLTGLTITALIPHPYHTMHEDLAHLSTARRFFGKKRPALARHLCTGEVVPVDVCVNEYVSGAKEAPMFFCEVRVRDSHALSDRHRAMLSAANGKHADHPLPSVSFTQITSVGSGVGGSPSHSDRVGGESPVVGA
eukprot:TRINITY_DN16638_c0_g1_i1.p1 TRINITY_DN16638_c0_g1~~TRINITY_DN16638_c0_g1_i1.p1  ORF type:complete len:518 (+),score=153.55 TRINITY_DN16638_c0_g1_i1:97-1650(+)